MAGPRGGPAGAYPGTTIKGGLNILTPLNSGRPNRKHVRVIDQNGNLVDPSNPSNLLLQTVQVAVTAAQIKAMSTTPITLVTAQGAGTFIEYVAGWAELKYGTVQYAQGSAPANYAICTKADLNGIIWYLDGSGGPLYSAIISNSSQFVALPATVSAQSSAGASASLNQPLVLGNAATNDDVITGNGTLIVQVVYRVWSGLS